MASRQRRLKVWLYSTRKDDHRATSIACKTSILSTGGNSTNMQKHLSTQHAITLQKCHIFDALRIDDNRATSIAFKTSILSTGGNSTNMQKHLSTQHAITLQKCHIFDALRSDDNLNESQPSNSNEAYVSALSVNIEGKLLQTLSIVLVPFVSLCKPAFTICLFQFYFYFNLNTL